MKSVAAGLLAFVMTAVAAAQTPPPPAWTWVTYNSPDGTFSARFPTTPTTGTQQSKTSDGQPLTQLMVSAAEGDNLFLLGHFEILPSQVFNLGDARDGMLRNVNGTLLSETAITVGGHPGTDLVITTEAQGNSYVMNVRTIHTPRRAYVLQAIYLRTAPHQSEKTARFFGSFQIIR